MPQFAKHICFVAPHAYPFLADDNSTELIGGAEVQQVFIAKALVARGYRISMICLNFGQPDQVEVEGIRIYRAYRPHEGIPVFRFLCPRLTSIWSAMKSVGADIYYQRAAGMLTGVMAAYCNRYCRRSIFAAAGNPDLVRNTPRIQYARDRWIYEYGIRKVDRIVVQNAEQARLCQANFNRVATLVPSFFALPDSATKKGTPRYVLWVSTIRSLKRPDLFLDLAEALPEVKFRMVGGPGVGEAGLYESIRGRAQGIANLEFKGFQPYATTDCMFDDSSVFVNTSESEGFPNTFLQAWARAVPTVSFIDSGARTDGVGVGWQVATLEELIRVVRQCATDEVARMREGERCKKYFDTNHSLSHAIETYEGIFEGLG